MGILNLLFGNNSRPSGNLDPQTWDDLEKYIKCNFGKQYVTQDKLDEYKRARQKINSEKEKLERLRKQSEAERATKEISEKEGSTDNSDMGSARLSDDARYSLAADDDIDGLASQADSYFSYLNNFSSFTPVKGFKELLLEYMISSGMDNVEIYKRANISKSVFSSIITKGHTPKKSTVIALAVALKLDLRKTERLLMKAGYTFSNSIKGDLIAVYFINHKIYDIDIINIALHENGQPILGSKA